jgi:serine/threonine protein phosphatase PrpC
MTSGKTRSIGTTVVAIATNGRGFVCLWAGDSRAYLARDGVLRQLTRDHSLVQQLVDAGDLDPLAAADHPNANIITRAVGAAARLEIDSVEGEVRPGDAFLLASDGFTRLIAEAEMLAALQSSELEETADRLVETMRRDYRRATCESWERRKVARCIASGSPKDAAWSYHLRASGPLCATPSPRS